MSHVPPCRNCSDRHMGCHSSECEKWVEYEKQHKEDKEKELKKRMEYATYAGYVRDQSQKIYKANRRKR